MERRVYTVDEVDFDIIKSNPSKIVVLVKGTTRTAGWKHGRLVPHSNNLDSERPGVYELDFVADPPISDVADVITPITAEHTFYTGALGASKGDSKVIVYSETNNKEKDIPIFMNIHNSKI